MSSLIVLHQVRVENANAIAGLTYGFPAITHFLGYSHALSRKLQSSHGLTLRGCAVICHHQQVHAYSSGRDYVFSLTRNPLTKEAKTAAFNEEGRMHMTVSLVIECDGTIANGDDGANALEKHLASLCLTQRLAGGTITNIRRVKVINYPETEVATRRLLCRLLPGFALLDRSELLAEHLNRLRQTNLQAEMLDAWLDFSALKIQAIPRRAIRRWKAVLLHRGVMLVSQQQGIWSPLSLVIVPFHRCMRRVKWIKPVTRIRRSALLNPFMASVSGAGCTA